MYLLIRTNMLITNHLEKNIEFKYKDYGTGIYIFYWKTRKPGKNLTVLSTLSNANWIKTGLIFSFPNSNREEGKHYKPSLTYHNSGFHFHDKDF